MTTKLDGFPLVVHVIDSKDVVYLVVEKNAELGWVDLLAGLTIADSEIYRGRVYGCSSLERFGPRLTTYRSKAGIVVLPLGQMISDVVNRSGVSLKGDPNIQESYVYQNPSFLIPKSRERRVMVSS